MTEPSPHAIAASAAAAQHGVIGFEQARAKGLTARQIDHAVRTGRWIRIGRGVFRVAGAPHTWRSEVMAACLATNGVASHRSAAVLLGLPGFGTGTPEITVARGRHSGWRGVRVHESGDLDLVVARRVDGIPTTDVPRTILDLGAVARDGLVEEALFHALDRRLVTWDDVVTTLVRHACRGRNGVGPLRRVIERNLHLGVPQSKLEVLFLRLLEDGGLPPPQRQIEIVDDRGFVARVDAGYTDHRLLFELDGRSVHARRQAFEADALKRNRVRLAGYQLLVYTWHHVLREPRSVLDQVRTALATPHPLVLPPVDHH